MQLSFFHCAVLRLVAIAVLFVACGCGGGGSESVVNAGTPNQAGGSAPKAKATVTLRVPPNTPGAAPLAFDGPSRWNPLRWISQPALAQAFYTLPGARVDAIGKGFTFADHQGVARFLGLGAGETRFAVSTSDPGVVFQTLANLQAGVTVTPRLDEFTTAATLLATSAAQSLNTGATDIDLDTLVVALQNNSTPELSALRTLVESRLSGSKSWIDLRTFLPHEEELLEALEVANQSVTYKVTQVPLAGQAIPTEPIILSFTFNNPVNPKTLPGLGAQGWTLIGPAGLVIDDRNLQALGGSAHYSGLQGSGGDGRAYPPNTFYFRLPANSQPAGTSLEYTLAMQELPRDIQGREVLSLRPADSYTVWSFSAFGPGTPGAKVESNVTGSLDFQASNCQGDSNANLSSFGPPAYIAAQFDLSQFSFHYSQLDRDFQLNLTSSEPLQVGKMYSITPDDQNLTLKVSYSELHNNGLRNFIAQEGTVTLVSVSENTVVVEADLVLKADETQYGQGSFCLKAKMTSVFP